MTVYLLHFESPIAPGHPCQHYIGFTESLGRRLNEHARGYGSRLTQVARERGIGWVLARTWPQAGRRVERALKSRRQGRDLCPVCSPDKREGLCVAGWSRKRLVRPRMTFQVASRERN